MPAEQTIRTSVLTQPHCDRRLCHGWAMSISGGHEPASFSVASRVVDAIAVIAVTGEVDAHTAPAVREAIETVIAPGAQLVVDLTSVSFLDSTGLGVFVTALKHLREVEGSLDLVVTSPRVLKVFELTGLDVVIPIHEELGSALGS